jgi:subtilisin family serine protease
MSLGGYVGPGADDNNCGNTNDDPLHLAICNSVNDAKVTYAVAAGNDFEDVKDHIPAAYDEVITVSALADYNGLPGGGAPNTCNQDNAIDDDFAWFSNYATLASDQAHMLAAPGVCIKSTWKAVKKGKRKVPGYKTISGTSMASPHVAGAAAVYLANQNPGASPAQVRSFMLAPENSEDTTEGHTDIYEYNPEPVLQMNNY